MTRIAAIIVLIFIINPNYHAVGQSEDKLGSWFIYNGFFNVSPKIELFFESQLRNYEVFSNPETFFLRPYFNYNLTKSFQTGLGLEYHKSWTYAENQDDKESANEFRITLQGMLFQKVDRVNIQHRYRYEFRHVDEDKLQRMRYRIQATIPLNNKTIEKGTIFANVFNEIMADTEPRLQLSQNRVYFAGGYQFSQNLNFQFGYLIVSRASNSHHRLQFFLTHKLYFYERE